MTDPQRILHAIASLDGYGRARMLRRLAPRQAAAGAQVAVAALRAQSSIAAELRAAGVTVHVLGSRWPFDPLAALGMRRLCTSTRSAGILHAWDVDSLLHARAFYPRRGPARIIAELSGEEVLRASGKFARRWYGHVDAIVAPDEGVERQLQRLSLGDSRIHIIPRGVPVGHARGPQHAAWLESWQLPADARVIAIAGPLVRRSAADEAIWCFELVRVLYPEARLLVLGDGPDRARLERFADEVSEPGCVHFLGYRADVAEILPHADVYWQLTSSTATPLALLEAQAAGVPVVVSDVAAHREAIEADETGLRVPPGNRAAVTRATDHLFRDPAAARRMGAAGAARVAARWPLESSLAAYERLYAELRAS